MNNYRTIIKQYTCTHTVFIMNLIKTVMEGDCTVNNLLQTAEKNDTSRVCGYSIVPGGLSCILANMA